MKIQSLMLAVALAASGAAFAATPNSTGTAPAYPGTATTTTSSTTAASNGGTLGEKMDAGAHKTKRAAKRMAAKTRHAAHHANMKTKHRMHHGHARTHAHHGTHAMGAAAPTSQAADVDTASRQERVDQAYANWKSKSKSGS